jgi:regulation of enolase protein 1 (concanavalin A-like superfamily)
VTSMTDTLAVPELPFPVVPTPAGVWRRESPTGPVTAQAQPRTDFYVNPAGADTTDAPSRNNGATLLGTPPEGDFQLSARVSVDFRTQFDAGVLMLWVDEANWAKLCFEFAPAGEPMVVSVVTMGYSDDANSFVVPERTIRLRISRIGLVYAFHASSDEATWQLIRVFRLGSSTAGHQVGFEAQSPIGEGCSVSFDDVRFTSQPLRDLRDGS